MEISPAIQTLIIKDRFSLELLHACRCVSFNRTRFRECVTRIVGGKSTNGTLLEATWIQFQDVSATRSSKRATHSLESTIVSVLDEIRKIQARYAFLSSKKKRELSTQVTKLPRDKFVQRYLYRTITQVYRINMIYMRCVAMSQN